MPDAVPLDEWPYSRRKDDRRKGDRNRYHNYSILVPVTFPPTLLENSTVYSFWKTEPTSFIL